MIRMEYVKNHRHILEYLALRASPMKKNYTEFRLKVKIKTIYKATVVYLHGITFAVTH